MSGSVLWPPSWEIAIKSSLGRGDLPVFSRDALRYFLESGFQMRAIDAEHALAVETLPAHHQDPFDHCWWRSLDRTHEVDDPSCGGCSLQRHHHSGLKWVLLPPEIAYKVPRVSAANFFCQLSTNIKLGSARQVASVSVHNSASLLSRSRASPCGCET